MATVHFRSLNEAEIVEIEFVPLQGDPRTLRLLVDSGFTGRSSVLLGNDAADLVRAAMPPTQTAGALHGTQNRGWVMCHVPAINFQATVAAILTDLGPLSLPDTVQGMAGLSFLRHFTRWGAERDEAGWRFFLTEGQD